MSCGVPITKVTCTRLCSDMFAPLPVECRHRALKAAISTHVGNLGIPRCWEQPVRLGVADRVQRNTQTASNGSGRECIDDLRDSLLGHAASLLDFLALVKPTNFDCANFLSLRNCAP